MSQPPRAFRAQYGTVLEITLETLRHDPELRLCEGIRLIEVTGSHGGGQVTVNGTLREPRWQTACDLRISGRNSELASAQSASRS